VGTAEENRSRWSAYEWRLEGDEWSFNWGGPDYEWWGTIFTRVQEFLPTGNLLEIAPGYGRWTRYLVHLCEKLIGVDVAPKCVEACQQRFANYPNASFHLNDGVSLDMVPDGSIDFAFSYGSLVHADREVIERYVHELAGKLKPDGVAFIHHSNLAEYLDPETGSSLPFENGRWRGNMSAPLFEQYCADAGLACIGQEIINWVLDKDREREREHLIDCFSLLTPPGSRFERPNRVRRNDAFTDEVRAFGKIARFYGPAGFPGVEETPPSERAARMLGRDSAGS
jgi:hypothetical protein